jgi:hypothetical protein
MPFIFVAPCLKKISSCLFRVNILKDISKSWNIMLKKKYLNSSLIIAKSGPRNGKIENQKVIVHVSIWEEDVYSLMSLKFKYWNLLVYISTTGDLPTLLVLITDSIPDSLCLNSLRPDKDALIRHRSP